jgi:hypothetical protein
MPNINVKKKLESIRTELSRVADHVGEHSGIDLRDARLVEATATEIATLGFQIAALACDVQGNTDATSTVMENLRRAVDV